MDNVRAFAVLAGELAAQRYVRAFGLVVHGLADIVQQAGALGQRDIRAEFSGHDARQMLTSMECLSTFWRSWCGYFRRPAA